MPTKWVITTPSDHIALDDTQRGQTTFTVTNPTDKLDRVVFDIVPGDDADPSWFSIDEPQRRVPPNGSVSYLMTAEIPTDAPPGTYSVRGRVYSADSAPEEGSVLSGRLAVEVKPKAEPVKRRLPWWVFVVAGLVVVVLVVVLVLVFTSGGGKPTPEPSRSLGPSVKVPDLNHQSQAQATTNLGVFGLTVGTVRHVQSSTPDQVVYQSVAGGSTVPRDTSVDLVVTAALVAPTPTLPKANAVVPLASVRPQVTPVPKTPPLPSPGASPSATPGGKGTPSPSPSATPADVLRWTDHDAFVSRWLVTIDQEMCTTTQFVFIPNSCFTLTSTQVVVDRPGYTPVLTPTNFYANGYFQLTAKSHFQWQVAAIDDFGNVGPGSAWTWFTVQ